MSSTLIRGLLPTYPTDGQGYVLIDGRDLGQQ